MGQDTREDKTLSLSRLGGCKMNVFHFFCSRTYLCCRRSVEEDVGGDVKHLGQAKPITSPVLCSFNSTMVGFENPSCFHHA